MKKLYTLLAALLLVGSASAQSVVSACNDPEGGIQIYFDDTQNCTAAPGELSGLDSLGFHSGANQWSSTVDWNADGALQAQALSADSFRVYINDIEAYYGITDIENIYFVFNQGPIDPDNPWDSEGKQDDGQGGCADLFITLAEVTEACATTASVRDQIIDLGFKVAPNPMTNQTVISFDNPTRESFQVKVMGLDGRVVREMADVRGEQITFERGNLPSGLYFVNFVNEAGKRASTSLMVK